MDNLWYPLFLIVFVYISIDKTIQNKAKYIGILLFFISAVRYGISYDYFIYVRHTIFDFRHEEFLSGCLETIGNVSHPQVFFIISSFLITFVFFRIIRSNSKDPYISSVFYIGYPIFFLTSLSTVRQALATAFVFCILLIDDSRKRGVLLKIILLIIAWLFHHSSLIVVLALFPIDRIKRIIWLFMLLGSFLMGNIIAHVLPLIISEGYIGGKLNAYLGEAMEGHKLELFLIYLVTFVIYMLHPRLVDLDYKNDKYIKYVYLATIVLNLFSGNSHMAIRCYAFFASPLLLLVPDLISIMRVKKNIFVIGCIIYLILGLYVINLYVDSKYHIYPFRAFWEIPQQNYYYDCLN